MMARKVLRKSRRRISDEFAFLMSGFGSFGGLGSYETLPAVILVEADKWVWLEKQHDMVTERNTIRETKRNITRSTKLGKHNLKVLFH